MSSVWDISKINHLVGDYFAWNFGSQVITILLKCWNLKIYNRVYTCQDRGRLSRAWAEFEFKINRINSWSWVHSSLPPPLRTQPRPGTPTGRAPPLFIGMWAGSFSLDGRIGEERTQGGTQKVGGPHGASRKWAATFVAALFLPSFVFLVISKLWKILSFVMSTQNAL